MARRRAKGRPIPSVCSVGEKRATEILFAHLRQVTAVIIEPQRHIGDIEILLLMTVADIIHDMVYLGEGTLQSF